MVNYLMVTMVTITMVTTFGVWLTRGPSGPGSPRTPF